MILQFTLRVHAKTEIKPRCLRTFLCTKVVGSTVTLITVIQTKGS